MSHISRSTFLAWEALMASNTTAPGSAPSWCLIISTSILLAQISNCSVAAALKVSAAANITFLPSFLYLWANLPIVVVLPTPFTPTITITAGPGLISSSEFPSFRIEATISFNKSLTSRGSFTPLSLIISLKRSIISIVVVTPTSAVIRISSRSSKSSSSIFV